MERWIQEKGSNSNHVALYLCFFLLSSWDIGEILVRWDWFDLFSFSWCMDPPLYTTSIHIHLHIHM